MKLARTDASSVRGGISLEDHRQREQHGSYDDSGANLAAKPCPVRISMFHLHHPSKEDQQEQKTFHMCR
jgi:hypothetical protein